MKKDVALSALDDLDKKKVKDCVNKLKKILQEIHDLSIDQIGTDQYFDPKNLFNYLENTLSYYKTKTMLALDNKDVISDFEFQNVKVKGAMRELTKTQALREKFAANAGNAVKGVPDVDGVDFIEE